MLSLDKYIDLVIPRGGKKLVENVSKNAKMRAIFGGIGVCHLYIDEKLDYKNVLPIINNAKLQAPSVCNALDTILIHEKQLNNLLPKIVSELNKNDLIFFILLSIAKSLTDGVFSSKFCPSCISLALRSLAIPR